MPTLILGIDPGLTGALCYLGPGGIEAITDIPTLKVGSKTTVNVPELAARIDAWSTRIAAVWIEYVSASPQMGVTSAFSFGETYGLLKGICAAHFIPIHTVTPNVWKTAMKAKGDKDESRARASALYPHSAGLFALKKHHGRADAALIASYGARQSRIEALSPQEEM